MSLYLTIAASSLAIGAAVYTVKKIFGGNKIPVGGYEKDVVYLYQFPRSKTMANLSPFCVKVETFLRMNNIKYECIFTLTGRSKQGLLPFVILNGEQIDDSELIVDKLTKYFNLKTSLNPQEEALAHAVSRLADNHLYYVIQSTKMFSESGFLLCCTMLRDNGIEPYLPNIIFILVAGTLERILQRKMKKRISTALGMFPEEDFELLLRKDLNAIRDIIGENKFLFGSEMCSADCTVFAHLATVFWLPYWYHVKNVIGNEYPTIFKYLQSVRQTVYGKSGEEFC